jgi:hypothetical protein
MFITKFVVGSVDISKNITAFAIKNIFIVPNDPQGVVD